MKRIISILFLLAGIAFTNSAFAQTSHPKKKDRKESDKASSQKGGGDASGGGSITVDEQGTPRVKSKSPNVENPTTTPSSDTASPPKEQKESGGVNQKADNDDDSPSPIAIDEGGIPKIKSKPTTVDNPNSSTGLSSDSTTIAPASGVERPH